MPDGNPYSRMVSVMQADAGAADDPAKLRVGTVARREPLEIVVAGLNQPAEALKINRNLRNSLETGDTVLLLTEDDQLFYVLMKVVDAI